ncbi:MAG: hypothetical protein DME86_13040 [Verrucomicrobia bacterium]|nr:MAG: hypothetical protein DME86_13040 [Verrucomicrobiota bacterium]
MVIVAVDQRNYHRDPGCLLTAVRRSRTRENANPAYFHRFGEPQVAVIALCAIVASRKKAAYTKVTA